MFVIPYWFVAFVAGFVFGVAVSFVLAWRISKRVK